MNEARINEKADFLIKKSKKAGADSVDVLYVENTNIDIGSRLKRIEKLERSESNDMGLRFIKNKKPVVISLNTVEYLPLSLVDIFAFLNEFRIVAEFEKIKDCNGKILVPANLVPSGIINSIAEDRILHYPVKIESNSFKSNEINAVIPYEIVFAYAISAILLGSPNIIYLYGFDGYRDGDTRQSQMLEILKLIDKANTLNVPICSITNSTYPILQKSFVLSDHDDYLSSVHENSPVYGLLHALYGTPPQFSLAVLVTAKDEYNALHSSCNG